jgi:tRNA G46 methylase TrmB
MLRFLRAIRHVNRSPQIVQCIRGTKQWLPLARAYLEAGSLNYPHLFRSRINQLLELNDATELTTLWHVFFASEYAARESYHRVIDLGANIGAFAIWIAGRLPKAKILAVEPFPPTFDRLKANVQRNHLSERITCVPVAAAASDGELLFDASKQTHSYARSSV